MCVVVLYLYHIQILYIVIQDEQKSRLFILYSCGKMSCPYETTVFSSELQHWWLKMMDFSFLHFERLVDYMVVGILETTVTFVVEIPKDAPFCILANLWIGKEISKLCLCF